MARIRAIKPQFFRHSDLYDAEKASGLPLRIAYAGLWCVADREGRFKWKPREIKTEVLPYDDVDFAAVLDALVLHRFVIKYECDGDVFGLIPKFKEHQHINKHEPESSIPAPPQSGAKKVRARAKTVQARGEGNDDGKGMEGKEEDAPAARDVSPKGFELPEWIPSEPWLAFLEMRQRKRAPLTDNAKDLTVKKLGAMRDAGQDPAAVLNQSVMNTWTGIFPVKQEDANVRGRQGPSEGKQVRAAGRFLGTLEQEAQGMAGRAGEESAAGTADGRRAIRGTTAEDHDHWKATGAAPRGLGRDLSAAEQHDRGGTDDEVQTVLRRAARSFGD